jgi:hypothetical protein
VILDGAAYILATQRLTLNHTGFNRSTNQKVQLRFATEACRHHRHRRKIFCEAASALFVQSSADF